MQSAWQPSVRYTDVRCPPGTNSGKTGRRHGQLGENWQRFAFTLESNTNTEPLLVPPRESSKVPMARAQSGLFSSIGNLRDLHKFVQITAKRQGLLESACCWVGKLATGSTSSCLGNMTVLLIKLCRPIFPQQRPANSLARWDKSKKMSQ